MDLAVLCLTHAVAFGAGVFGCRWLTVRRLKVNHDADGHLTFEVRGADDC